MAIRFTMRKTSRSRTFPFRHPKRPREKHRSRCALKTWVNRPGSFTCSSLRARDGGLATFVMKTVRRLKRSSRRPTELLKALEDDQAFTLRPALPDSARCAEYGTYRTAAENGFVWR